MLCLIVVALGCRRESAHLAPRSPALPIVAQVGDSAISVADFQAELARRARSSPGRYDSAEQRASLLDEMIQFEVLFARAKAAGYDELPELRERFRHSVVSKYEQDHAPKSDEPPASVEIQNYYKAHVAEFSEPEKVRPAILFLRASSKATAEKKQEALAHAEQVRAEVLASQQPGFGDLARRYSDDAATRYTGGDCGWVVKTSKAAATPWPEDVVKAMFSLQPGEVSPIIATPGGHYLVKVIEHAEAAVQPLERVRDRIAWKVQTERARERQKQFQEQQRAGLRVVVNHAALDAITGPETKIAQKDAAPPSVPGR